TLHAALPILDADGCRQQASLSGTEGDLCRRLDALVRERREVIERDTPQHWRRAGGYRLERLLGEERHLAHLLCGSEGTLGFVTGVTLGLVERPRQTALGVVHYEARR